MENITPSKLILKLSAYFLVLISAVIIVLTLYPESLRYLPLGGIDALQSTDIEITESRFDFSSNTQEDERPGKTVTPDQLSFAMIFLVTHLVGTILVMLPIAWTYSATNFATGPR